jgi:hypothetical protein
MSVGIMRIALFLAVTEEVEECALLTVVVVRGHLEVPHDPITGMRMRVGQLHDVVSVVAERVPLRGIDDDRAVGPIRLLKACMAMKPVGSALDDRKVVGEGLARCDPFIADTRHAILLEGQNQTMPVNGGGFREIVRHVDGDVLSLFEA